jgi:hypothetical protein
MPANGRWDLTQRLKGSFSRYSLVITSNITFKETRSSESQVVLRGQKSRTEDTHAWRI